MGAVVIALINAVDGFEGEQVVTVIPLVDVLRFGRDRQVAVAILR